MMQSVGVTDRENSQVRHGEVNLETPKADDRKISDKNQLLKSSPMKIAQKASRLFEQTMSSHLKQVRNDSSKGNGHPATSAAIVH